MYKKSRHFVTYVYVQRSSSGVINNVQLTINKVTIPITADPTVVVCLT